MLKNTQILKRIDRAEQHYMTDEVIHFTLNDDFSSNVTTRAKEYEPSKTGLAFHQCDDEVKVIMGPFGSGKSVMCCHEALYRAVTMPKCNDGIRRSRGLIVRNTAGKIETTTLTTWLQWFGRLPLIEKRKKPILTYKYRFADKDGVVEIELLFMGLDREDQRDALESLELTWCYFNEIQHIPEGIFSHMTGRVGRFPAKWQIDKEYWGGILGDTNPPDTDHWLYKYFEINKILGTSLFKQPPGLIKDKNSNWIDNPEADNIKNLKKDYYFDYARKNKFREEIIKVYCRGEWGIVVLGKHVFDEYNDDVHSVEDVQVLENQPIYIRFDFGYTPACLLMQFRDDGQLRCIKEFTTERMGIREFARSVVIPYINANFEGYTFDSKGDPAGDAGSNISEVAESAMEILKEEGLPTDRALTNVLLPRLEAVKYYLNTLMKGEPAIVISRKECPQLRKALSGHYCYKRMRVIGEERYRDVPNKTHPFSDIVDCLQYGALDGHYNKKMLEREFDISKYSSVSKY